MRDKVVIVTPPDDVIVDGIRILLIDLDGEQRQVISNALTQLPTMPAMILYLWNTTDPIEWLLDKKIKSDLIIFNANSENDVIIGYMAAQTKSYYFGTLKSLSAVNDSTIYTTEQVSTILEKVIKQYGL
jgi:hypothetical protein